MSEPVSAVVTLVNIRGLHARASAKFCAVAESFEATIKVSKDDFTVGGSSIMGLMTLGAGVGSEIAISAEGPQAAEAVHALVRLVEERFGEGE